MKQASIAIATLCALLFSVPGMSQDFPLRRTALSTPASDGDDVFVPVSKYMAGGNAEALSAWFSDNLEVSVLGKVSEASRAQARQIVKTFFEAYSPRSFDVNHTASRANIKHALGTLRAGGETFSVTILMGSKGDSYQIKQLKIER